DADVHPRPPALLLGAAVRIEIKRGQRASAVVLDAEETDVGMPDRPLPVRGANRDAEEPPGEREEPIENPREREVRSELLVAVVVPLLAEALRPERHVPGLQVARFGS